MLKTLEMWKLLRLVLLDELEHSLRSSYLTWFSPHFLQWHDAAASSFTCAKFIIMPSLVVCKIHFSWLVLTHWSVGWEKRGRKRQLTRQGLLFRYIYSPWVDNILKCCRQQLNNFKRYALKNSSFSSFQNAQCWWPSPPRLWSEKENQPP